MSTDGPITVGELAEWMAQFQAELEESSPDSAIEDFLEQFGPTAGRVQRPAGRGHFLAGAHETPTLRAANVLAAKIVKQLRSSERPEDGPGRHVI